MGWYDDVDDVIDHLEKKAADLRAQANILEAEAVQLGDALAALRRAQQIASTLGAQEATKAASKVAAVAIDLVVPDPIAPVSVEETNHVTQVRSEQAVSPASGVSFVPVTQSSPAPTEEKKTNEPAQTDAAIPQALYVQVPDRRDDAGDLPGDALRDLTVDGKSIHRKLANDAGTVKVDSPRRSSSNQAAISQRANQRWNCPNSGCNFECAAYPGRWRAEHERSCHGNQLNKCSCGGEIKRDAKAGRQCVSCNKHFHDWVADSPKDGKVFQRCKASACGMEKITNAYAGEPGPDASRWSKDRYASHAAS